MFEGFRLDYIDVGEAVLRVRHGGAGPAVLLLHGHPRTHTTWYRVAPLLAAENAVVCPDLRGYGESSKPPTTPNHEPYSKRAMARDCVTLMRKLGHERFAVVGHDRGAYVALRTALDHPDVVDALVVMDAVPIAEALDRCDASFARAWWHWFFLGQTDKPAEDVISGDPEGWYRPNLELMGDENYADYVRAIHNPATVRAMCEDYRAGLGVDRDHDEADRGAGRRVVCPTLVLWALQDDMEDLYGDPLAIWRPWAEDVIGGALDCGHHMAEEVPQAVAEAITRLLSAKRLANRDIASELHEWRHEANGVRHTEAAVNESRFELKAIGKVESPLTDLASAPKQGDEGAPDAYLNLEPGVLDALEGIGPEDEVIVLTWLHHARRDVLRVHPRGDLSRAQQGVFSTRSPHRPNPIGLHVVKIVAMDGGRVRVRNLEAVNGTPIVDLKPVLNPDVALR